MMKAREHPKLFGEHLKPRTWRGSRATAQRRFGGRLFCVLALLPLMSRWAGAMPGLWLRPVDGSVSSAVCSQRDTMSVRVGHYTRASALARRVGVCGES